MNTGQAAVEQLKTADHVKVVEKKMAAASVLRNENIPYAISLVTARDKLCRVFSTAG